MAKTGTRVSNSRSVKAVPMIYVEDNVLQYLKVTTECTSSIYIMYNTRFALFLAYLVMVVAIVVSPCSHP